MALPLVVLAAAERPGERDRAPRSKVEPRLIVVVPILVRARTVVGTTTREASLIAPNALSSFEAGVVPLQVFRLRLRTAVPVVIGHDEPSLCVYISSATLKHSFSAFESRF